MSNIKDLRKLYTLKRIDLDQARDFDDVFWDNNFDFSFRSIWVYYSNSKSIDIQMKPGKEKNLGDPLPLFPNASPDFGEVLQGASFKFPAQSGKFIIIVFAHDTKVEPGMVNFDITGLVSVKDGASADTINKTVTTNATEIVAADSNRSAEIYNYSAQTLYVGPSAKVADANFKKHCPRILPNGAYEWRNDCALFARFENSTSDDIVVLTHLR